ncbi:MAG: pyridoxamine 5'-phosphate oxidase family protein [Pseudomonadales bacterium]
MEETTESLKQLTNHLYPDRWDYLRAVTRKERNATTVLALPITEASAKRRTGGPGDDAEDSNLPIWAGVVPMLYLCCTYHDNPGQDDCLRSNARCCC